MRKSRAGEGGVSAARCLLDSGSIRFVEVLVSPGPRSPSEDLLFFRRLGVKVYEHPLFIPMSGAGWKSFLPCHANL